MTRITERYASAANSSNLSSKERTTWSDSDVLGAAGLAAKEHELGIALMRLFTGGKSEPVIAQLTEIAFKRARTLEITPFPVLTAKDMAVAVLGWYRHGTCAACGGTGKQLIPDTPHLSDKDCGACYGSGRIAFEQQFQHKHRPVANWLRREIDRSQGAAGRAAMAAIAPDFDL